MDASGIARLFLCSKIKIMELEEHVVNLMHTYSGKNLYFSIGDRRASVGKQTFVTVGREKTPKIGDEIYVESILGRVVEVQDGERKVINSDLNHQKLIIEIIKNNHSI